MSRFRSLPLPLATLTCLAWMSACDEPPRATTVTVTPSNVEMTSLGETEHLGAEVVDQYGAVMPGVDVTWSSSAATIAEVFASGLVKATGNGTATVTATAAEATGTATVKVMQATARVTVSPYLDTVPAGDTVRLTAVAFDENSYAVEDAEFTWSSSEESVATVDQSGLVGAVSDGFATVTATAGDVDGEAWIVVLHRDRMALEALYRATNGPNWWNNNLWMGDAPMGDWHGVETENGNVTEIDLGHNRLSGPIPPELGNLADLRVLNLGLNGLTGPIPPELGNLANLTVLDLGQFPLRGGQLSGPIPPELGNLAKLTVLELDHNRLTGPLPEELADLAALRLLRLDKNLLTGPVPAAYGRMSRLHELTLSFNEGMAGPLPSELTSLRRLGVFLASGTDLCVPSDPDFRSWLDGMYKRRIDPCDPEPLMAYLTQAVQSRLFPVPLVEGERALLRVFVTARKATGEGIPPVTARFYVDGEETHVEEIPGKSTPIPTEVDEGDLAKSANAEIPADVIEPGLEMVIEVDPEGTLDEDLLVAKRIPETGRLAVDVPALPVFDLTIIPFVWSTTHDSSIVDLVEGLAEDPDGDSLLWHTRTLLPIGDLEVTAHEPVLSSSNSAFDLLSRTGAIRVMEGGTGHYKGTMGPPVGGAGGVAHAPGRSSFSQPRGYIFAHELGHNLSLYHAPCVAWNWLDPAYPYTDGTIGAWGFDFRGDSLMPPSSPDLMSYCGPRWISDYHFANGLRFRLSDADSVGLPYLEPQRSLLLWGGMGADSVPFLEPAFVVEAPPALPGSGGEYRLTGRSRGGTELFSLSFAMPEVADGDGSASFAFAVPVHPAWEHRLDVITLFGPGGSAMLDSGSDRPVVILRDPRSGQVRAILHDVPELDLQQADPGAALGAGPGLEVFISRGIPDSAAWRR